MRILTVAEWRAEVGSTHFELMTDPGAQYRSRNPLSPFHDLVTNYRQNHVQKIKELFTRRGGQGDITPWDHYRPGQCVLDTDTKRGAGTFVVSP